LQLDKTNLLSRLVEIWGEVPVRLIQHLDPRKSVYGIIGMKDFTMWPLIRPGSIVQIDGNQRKVLPIKWENEHERPIYFIELRKEYICSWCEIREGHLLAVPYPNSRCEIRRFPYPKRRISSDVSPAWPCASLGRTPELRKKPHPLSAGRTTIVPPIGELPCPNAGSQTTGKIAVASTIIGW
jgi:hypothetical protein